LGYACLEFLACRVHAGSDVDLTSKSSTLLLVVVKWCPWFAAVNR
jgi:hypothetical protein